MKNKDVLLSICIPTYGVMEWMMPVLDSIYSQAADENLFEVVVTDNGNNKEFYDKMQEIAKEHKNLKYIKTESYSFLNEIDSYKNASGKFIKFINHRTKVNDGTIDYLINFVKNNEKEKPIVYFSNGSLNKRLIVELEDFDSYVRELSFYSSWSTGMAFWKEHFDAMPSHDGFNDLFPHTNILFDRKNEKKYIVDDNVLLEEIPVSHKNKGKYDLFHAFAVEYVSIILDLYRQNYISYETFESVRKQNFVFVRNLYYDFVFKKEPCSYDISNFDKSIEVFYSKKAVKNRIPFMWAKRVLKKILSFKKKK